MDPDYLPFHPNPKKPSYVPPRGAVDAHCHVFGPADRFPYHPKRKYTPCDAPKEKLFELRDYLGFSRNVIVQASCHGSDNAALVNALNAAGDLEDLRPFLESLASDQIVVVDHMGRPDVSLGVESDEFRAFMRLLEQNSNMWTKVSCPERLTRQAPDYSDVIPFARVLVESFPDRVLWGTDWPHPNMKSHVPDDGALVDVIPLIAVTEELQSKLLIDNPMRLYWGS
jgi:predicted TIM-barrel fold metal-dependent hydrolase